MEQTRLKELRVKKRYTQIQLSIKLGIDQSDLSKMERGVRTLSLPLAIKIADFFDVSLDYLAGLTDNPERNR